MLWVARIVRGLRCGFAFWLRGRKQARKAKSRVEQLSREGVAPPLRVGGVQAQMPRVRIGVPLLCCVVMILTDF